MPGDTTQMIPPSHVSMAHYLIQGELGHGGMGRVFLAEDTRLGRTVAVKLLPEAFARDAGRMGRLRHEARLLAAVNHPNIAAIYSLEETEPGAFFLVLEYVPGQNLAVRLGRGALPQGEASRVAAQIALALEAAHAREVIHQDLKPANVMLTPDGRVKVLDFGLARRGEAGVPPGPSGERVERSGTPGYMSPEQILWGRADERSDVFALGCILFECLSGRRAFDGGSVEERLAATVSREPDRSLLPAALSEGAHEFLTRCLAKDPAVRPRGGGEARDLLERLLRREEEEARRPGALPPTPHNLPHELTTFVGREAERAACARILSRVRLLTLTGAGGSGKTRLAIRLALERLAEHPDGIWFVDFAAVQDGARVPRAVGDAVGLRVGGAGTAALCRELASRRVLLLWDTCEHVVTACADLAAELLRHAPDLTVLATSREPLRIEGEHVFAVPPLKLLEAGAPETAGTSEAARLFLARAASHPRGPAAGEEALPLVEDICRRLDGIPLAIELAAARARVLSLEEIRARLTGRLRFLADEHRVTRHRHRALRATFDWSYDLLDREEQSLFRALAVLEPDFAIDAAAALHGDVRDEIEFLDLFTRLADKSLVAPATPGVESSRFRLLDTIREYALQRLVEHGGEEAARDRHARHYLALAEAAAPELIGPRQAVWLRRLEEEHANLLSALAWCARSRRRADRGLSIAGALWRFWFAHGHFELGRRWLKDALDHAAGLPPSAGRFEALLGFGALAFHQNDWATSDRAYQECIALSQRLRYPVGLGYALAGLGNVAMGREDYPGARARYEESIRWFENAGHERGVGLSLSNLGRVAELTGANEEARGLYERSLAIFREIGDRAPLALRLSSLSELSMRMGDRDAARTQLTECFALVRELSEKRAGAYALERCAALAMSEGDGRAAARFLGAAAALRERIASPLTPREGTALTALRARAREALGGTGFDVLAAEGRALAFAPAVRDALAWLVLARG